jgi:hypothetical protein
LIDTLIYVIILLCITACNGIEIAETGLTVIQPADAAHYKCGDFELLPKDFNVTGKLVVANPVTACNYGRLKNKGELRGNIALISGKLIAISNS